MRAVMRPRKITAVILLASLILSFGVIQEPAYAATMPAITAPSAVLLDYSSSRIVFSKTPYLKRAPASTTKILTAIVAMDHLNLNRVVTISSFVTAIEPSKAHLRPGEKYYARDLIRATLISSANDAAEVLGVTARGSRAGFARLMNQKTRAIGCRKSNFVNASGLPAANQYSTAYDMALIMREAQKYPFIVKTLATKSTVIASLKGRKIALRNHNRMLWRGREEVVGKTGWTRRARHCFVGEINQMGRKVFVSMLGSHRLWQDLKTLVDYQRNSSLWRIRQNEKLWGTAEIKKIQTALQRAGFNPGDIDGEIGPQTVQAIKSFQISRGLKADGVVGQETRLKLRSFEV